MTIRMVPVKVVSPTAKALIYAGFGFVVGAGMQLLQVAVAFSLNPVTTGKPWLLSAGAGIVAAGIAYSLPYLKAVLPAPPATS